MVNQPQLRGPGQLSFNDRRQQSLPYHGANHVHFSSGFDQPAEQASVGGYARTTPGRHEHQLGDVLTNQRCDRQPHDHVQRPGGFLAAPFKQEGRRFNRLPSPHGHINRRPLWDIVAIALLFGLAAISVTTLLPAFRRLKRHAVHGRKWAFSPKQARITRIPGWAISDRDPIIGD